jgi:pimeloyl-ACP methyl ester carboxylesterase
MFDLLDTVGQEQTVWAGHDRGSPVVWSLASYHPDHCHAVANLCVPYFPTGFTPASFLPLVDRNVYPEAEFPPVWPVSLFQPTSSSK